MEKIKTLELFGGIGAPRKALLNLGIPHKAIDYVEIDEKRVRVYNAMYAEHNKYQPESVVGYNLKPDILIHGSPCQDFSRAGERYGGSKGSCTRSSLLHETVTIVKNMGMWRPRVVIWENVKGVLDRDMIGAFNEYIQAMDELGYRTTYDVLNAMDFGVPQRRERVFAVSKLSGEPFNFAGVRARGRKAPHINEFLSDAYEEKHVIKAPSMLDKIPELNPDGHKRKGYNRMLDVIEDSCWTITERQDRCPNAGIIKLDNGHYRYLTELEAWRLMGFDDEDYERAEKEFPTRKGYRNATLYAMAGNSIVVPVLEAIFAELLEEY